MNSIPYINTTSPSTSLTLQSLSFLQEYLKMLLKTTLEIQNHNLHCYRTLCKEKKIAHLEQNPLIKLKLNQLFHCNTSDLKLKSHKIEKKTLEKKASKSFLSGNGAFKRRKSPTSDSFTSSEMSSPDVKGNFSDSSLKTRTSSNLGLEFNSKLISEGLLQGSVGSKKVHRAEVGTGHPDSQ
jgi:hypothetical protein